MKIRSSHFLEKDDVPEKQVEITCISTQNHFNTRTNIFCITVIVLIIIMSYNK